MAFPIPDTRPLFRPLGADVVAMLRSLSPVDWGRPTLAPRWRVRDVVAHLIDTALRRLSYHRDGMAPPTPAKPPTSERDFVGFINELNADWVRAFARLSPGVLVDLYAAASQELSEFVERLSDNAPALFPVSWAGDDGSSGLLDIGREFTEIWHHAAQVRDAVGLGPFSDPRWLRAVLEIAVLALPHSYRAVHAPIESSLVIEITGPSGGVWTLERLSSGWDISRGSVSGPTARATLADDVAWRLFFNALSTSSIEGVRLTGDLEIARPLLNVRSVIV